jgi:hypothetical protein
MLEKPETKMVRAAISGRAQAGGCDLMQPMWGLGFTPKVIWAIVKVNAKNSGPPAVAPHDLRRTCARLCRQAGGELEQIQFLFGHISVQTTERNLGCKQRFQNAVAFWEVTCRQMPSQAKEDLAGQLLYGDSLHVSR